MLKKIQRISLWVLFSSVFLLLAIASIALICLAGAWWLSVIIGVFLFSMQVFLGTLVYQVLTDDYQ